MLYDNLKKLDTILGKIIFKNFNDFSYNLFGHFYKTKICNLDALKDEKILSFYSNGYSKVGIINQDLIDEVNQHITHQLKKGSYIANHANKEFIITEKIFSIIERIVNQELHDLIKNLIKYYNQRIFLTNVMIKRNLPIKSDNTDKEYYNNFFHNDRYTYNMFKIFINLEDIKDTQGPFTFIKKTLNKDIVKLTKSHRLNINEIKDLDKIETKFIKNIGSKGDTLMCNTTEVIHRASEVNENNKRDMLFLEFAAFPLDDENIFKFKNEILQKKNVNKKLSKIFGYKKLINLYKQFSLKKLA